ISGGIDGKRESSLGHRVFDKEVHGATLTGAIYLTVAPNGSYKGRASFEIGCEQGKGRLYFADDSKGYRYIEATPGHPAKTSGWMIPGDPRTVMLEAVDGDATGVSHHFWRKPFAKGQ